MTDNPDFSHPTPPLLAQSPLHLDPATLDTLTYQDPALPGRLDTIALWHITYPSDDLTVQGVLAHPRTPGLYPCLIYNRGGTGDDGSITPADAALHLARIASWGYVVIASQYRGTTGSGGSDEFGGRDLNDVLNLFAVLDCLPEADSSRIGMWGWSRGGLMTYRAVAHTDRIAAAIIVAGVADAFDYMVRRPDMEQDVFARLIPRYYEERELALNLRSPICWPERLCKHTPLLLVHGGADERVHPTQTLRMATALHEHLHPFRLVLFEGGDHSLTEHMEEIYALAQNWLGRYVRDQ